MTKFDLRKWLKNFGKKYCLAGFSLIPHNEHQYLEYSQFHFED